MRSRNREVNIFNMSLLDILTGMLGAFLFLMLGLVPYYTKAKKKSGEEPVVNVVLNVAAHWNTPAKLDYFLMSPQGEWRGPDTASMPLSRRTKITDNSTTPGKGWQTTSLFAQEGERYLLAVSLQEPASPLSMSYTSLTMELMEAKIDPTGSGLAGYYPDMYCTFLNVSGIKPGEVYGVLWIEVTKDANKKEYYRQYDLNWDDASKFPLPQGVLPVPTPTAVPPSYTTPAGPGTYTPPPNNNTVPGNTPDPGSNTLVPPNNNVPGNNPPNAPTDTNTPAATPAKRSWWQFFFPSSK